MNIKDILSDKSQKDPSIFNQEYYGPIYKKTEKIVCAVFLITDNSKDKEFTKDIVRDVRKAAHDSLVAVVDIMVANVEGREISSAPWARELVLLKSLLFVLVVARGVSRDLVDVLAREIDGVIENIYELNHVDAGWDELNEAFESEPAYVRGERRKGRGLLAPFQRTEARRTPASGGVPPLVGNASGGRKESILAIIRARGVVSIKDISDSITDCSEKTIQRELIELIKDNIIIKEGERRWSKYKLI